MEADWEVEIGGDAPVIDACWEGFVDLRTDPSRIAEIGEGLHLPGLAEALVRLNAISSPVWTSKCDVWKVAECDPDQLDAEEGNHSCAVAAYIDLLPRSDQQWTFPAMAERACKYLCSALAAIPLRNCRADFVVRRAFITPTVTDLGITAYLTACGSSESNARWQLAAAVSAMVGVITRPQRPGPELKVQ